MHSVYAQITSRCNFTCQHCCFACTAKGHDMSMELFEQIVDLCADRDGYVNGLTLGGGEPTLHPLFWPMLRYASFEMSAKNRDQGCCTLGLVTNGSNTDDALKLAKHARDGTIWAALSQTPWHDPIAPQVIEAFKRTRIPRSFSYGHEATKSDDEDLRDIRTVEDEYVSPHGRAKKWGQNKRCCCDAIFISPKGEVYACGCRKKKLGMFSIELVEDLIRDMYFMDGNEESHLQWSCESDRKRAYRERHVAGYPAQQEQL